jgi:hypothetical protein
MKKLKPIYIAAIFFVLVIINFVLFSCAPSAKVPITRPAEINLKGIKQIVIGDIQGNVGTALSEALTEKLFISNQFIIVDRANLDKMLKEQALGASGTVDEDTAIRIGKLIGASALIVGRSNANVNKSRRESQTFYDKNNKPYRYCHAKTEVNQSTSIKVIDLTTGQVVAVKNLSKSDDKEDLDKDRYPPFPTETPLINNTTKATVEEFTKFIVPYTELVEVGFENDKTPECKSGVAFAQNGDWRNALDQFKAAVKKEPSNNKSWYNLGVAYEYNFMYDEAISALKKSNQLKHSSKTISEIQNVKKLEADQKKLEIQQSDN